MNRISLFCGTAFLLSVGMVATALGQSGVESEIRQLILDSNAYVKTNLEDQGDSYSKDGALEFWSSGGLLQEIGGSGAGRPGSFESFNLTPKHIRVISLANGQVAVAHYYSEGSFQPAGFPAVSHYLTRVSQVFVKEGGEWKIRSSHWSPVAGGSGTSQSAATD